MSQQTLYPPMTYPHIKGRNITKSREMTKSREFQSKVERSLEQCWSRREEFNEYLDLKEWGSEAEGRSIISKKLSRLSRDKPKSADLLAKVLWMVKMRAWKEEHVRIYFRSRGKLQTRWRGKRDAYKGWSKWVKQPMRVVKVE